ncbi:ABC transporter permease [Oscillospiraceae bacterium LTW-04]|nr:ABC transporter permease [Oscillospiraceae bacterium MB24-C1]
MKLVFQGWRIALRHSLGAMLSILICLALLFTAALAVLSAAPMPEPVKLAVVSLDDSSMPTTLIASVMASSFEGVATVTLLEPDENTNGYAAVLTLPQGFWNSIMTGENLAPALTVNVSSPLEGLWIRQLAQSAGRTLLSAQNAVGGLLSAMYAEGLSDDEINQKLFSADMALMESYLARKGLFDSQVLHTTGDVAVAAYYGSSAVSFVFFSLLFLLFPPLYALRQFAAFSQRRRETFTSCTLTAITLFALLCPLGVVALGSPIQNFLGVSGLLLILLCASLLVFCAAAFSSTAACGAAVTGLALIQTLFGGGLLPEALMPPPLIPLCRLLPLSLMRRLTIDAAFGAGFSDTGVALLWCILLTGGALLLWSRKEAV